MSTPRRALGTGPITTRTTEADGRTPRLLPAERAEPEPLPQADGHQGVTADRKDRRPLGPGATTPPTVINRE